MPRFRSYLYSLAGGIMTLLATGLSAQAQTYSFDNPVDGSVESGVGVISGWHCTADAIRIEIDGNDIGNAGSGTRLLGTAAVCGHPDTGFSLLYNWNNLPLGTHTVKAYANGVLMGTKTIQTVKSAGQQFATGLTKSVVVPDFPEPGGSATLEWRQAKQSFVVTEVTAPPTVDPILAKTQLLMGTWVFSYLIGSTTFSQTYTLDQIPGTTNSQGGYSIFGTGQYGDPIVASYWPTDNDWTLLDPGSVIDRWFEFSTDGSTVNGCYFQISHPSETWSNCYTLTGQKTAAASQSAQRNKSLLPAWMKQVQDTLEAGEAIADGPAPSQDMLDRYQQFKRDLASPAY